MGWEMHEYLSSEECGKVAVLMGGNSAEREISLLSGQAVLASLLRSGIDAEPVDPAESDVFTVLGKQQFDRAIIMLHGRTGEDGKMQGALELMGLPYSGSGVLASALAMDKVRTKRVWQNLGLSTPAFVLLDEGTDWQEVMEAMGPVFVKPVKEGSSIGISRANDSEELKEAFFLAAKYDDVVIAEEFIDGPEYTVAILGDNTLPSVGMKAEREFYDYEAKYFADDTQYSCPSDLDQQAEKEIALLARQAYDALGCSGWGRVDIMRDTSGVFWLLEVNTVPGMTNHSLVPMAANALGIEFDELVLQILASSQADRERD